MTRLPKAIKQVCLVQVAAWVAWYPILIFTTTWIRDLCELERRSPEEGLRKGSLGMLCEAGVSLICSTVFPWLVRKSPILTLKHMWLASNIILAILSLLAFVVDDVTSAIVLTACVGVPWSIASWVPFAIIAAEMKKAQVEDDAGMVMGIHDMAINLAQAITVGTNSIIFQLVSRPDGELRGDDRAWVFLFGGYAAIVAACLTWRIEEESTKND